MGCYFLHAGHVVGVELLPLGHSDEDAVTRATCYPQSVRRPFYGYELWDGDRLVIRRPHPCAETPDMGQRRLPAGRFR